MSLWEQHIDRKGGEWLCNIKGCHKPYSGYYDITITGIGDFILHCDDPAHKEIAFAVGAEVDEQRRQDREAHKEKNEILIRGAIPQEEM